MVGFGPLLRWTREEEVDGEEDAAERWGVDDEARREGMIKDEGKREQTREKRRITEMRR